MRSPSPAPRKEKGEGKEKGEIKEDLKKILKDDLKGDLKKDLKDLKHEKDPKNAVNREETCPLLLRVFCSTSRHNNIQEYSKGDTPENEIQIYTWMDASLKELTGLIKEVNPDARRRGTFFEFALVYPDLRMGKYLSRDIGQTIAGKQGNDDNKTLGDCKFSIGDYMDIAISPPNQRMDRMDFGRRGGGFGGGRESFGGFGSGRFGGDRRDDRGGRDERGGRDDRERNRDREVRDRDAPRRGGRDRSRSRERGGRDRSL